MSRATWLIMRTPMAKSEVNTTPMAASSGTLAMRWMVCERKAVSTPTMVAPMNMGRISRLSVSMKAITKPGKMAWEMASPSRLMRRRTM